MSAKEVLAIYDETINLPQGFQFYKKPQSNILLFPQGNKRPNSLCIEDVYFGDSGKGALIAKLNTMLENGNGLVSLRYNGGSNAGHETVINGIEVITHQLPMGVVKENAIGIVSRGMVVHPEDFVTEMDIVADQFGGELPGTLAIDENALVATDTMRVLEYVDNLRYDGGRGSTRSGISPTYSSFYSRHPLFMHDFMSDDWEKTFRQHYKDCQFEIAGSGLELKDIEVPSLQKDGKRIDIKVGSEGEFIDRLRVSRERLKKYVRSDIPDFLEEVWKNPKIPVTIEGAQGAGIDPWHGTYPDITASRTMSRFVGDATYSIILPEEIAIRLGAMKTTYLSSVGSRVLPTTEDKARTTWLQQAFGEKGKSTGRLRGVYEISIPFAQYFQRAAGFDYLAPTHTDASKEGVPIRVITHYTQRGIHGEDTGKEIGYLPFQRRLDQMIPHYVEFPGWDGDQVKNAKNPNELEHGAAMFLYFISKTIAPIALTTHGRDLEDFIPWIAGLAA
ncbi:MAG: adenylosuccinate synthetase [Candidatus Daviesbacteria bacterium]|nr:adenylosuccinate synthetase [Candidatus Daviesbacteria bacterium]